MAARRGQAARPASPAPKPEDEPTAPVSRAPGSRRDRALWQLARAKRLVLVLSTLAAALSIVTLSTSPLEWVGGGDELSPASHCAVLGARDPARPLLAALTLVPVVALLLCAWCRPRSRSSLLLGGATLLLWAYRFHLRHPGC
ncbi:hypothetical protein KZ813_09465 [Sphingomonas sp. RHCKR7]|uniref:hypothetical protein n=1 Tax=Sphingomonas folli TaxID=2862497 RepID=UPI001CA51DDA|nr:hypothetical protein [Sphingomonas folli]MBW6527064.1 hypothetical protein [Sphingomonas folli]